MIIIALLLVGFQDYKDIILIYQILENILWLIAMEHVGRLPTQKCLSKIHVINQINKKVYKIILMVIFTWALLFRLVCRVIINLKGGKICIFNHIYILQIVKVWSCLQNILTAQKRKCQTQKSLRLIQHVLLIRILCYVRSLQYTYKRKSMT